MTHQQFIEYCMENKTRGIEPFDFTGFKLIFENGEYISIGSGYDGLTYTHVSEDIKTDGKQLFKDMNFLIPPYLPALMEKYGQ